MLRSVDTLFEAPLTALAVGPGIGKSEEALHWLNRAIEQKIPLLLDADALNLLAQNTALQKKVCSRSEATLLTPHPAEAARLLDCSIEVLQKNRLSAAQRLAGLYHSWVVLKGNGSLLVSPEGEWWINTNGNPGLATAGTGDVLSGLAISLLAQGFAPGPALRCAVHLHGAAADVLAEIIGGDIGINASELAEQARKLFNNWIKTSQGLPYEYPPPPSRCRN